MKRHSFLIMLFIISAATSFPSPVSAQEHVAPSVIRWSPSGDRIAVGYQTGLIEIWDAQSGEVIQTLEGHRWTVATLAWHPNGERLISGGGEGSYRVWDTITGMNLITSDGFPASIDAVEWNMDGSRMIVMAENGYMPVYDSVTGARLFYKLSQGSVLAMAWSPNKSQIALALDTAQVEIVDGQTLDHVALLGDSSEISGYFPPGKYLLEIMWSPDGNLVAAGSWEGFVYVWEVATGQLVLNPLPASESVGTARDSTVESVAFTPDSRTLMSITEDGTLRYWDVATGQVLVDTTIGEPVTAASFTSAGDLAASGSSEGTFPLIVPLCTVWPGAEGPDCPEPAGTG